MAGHSKWANIRHRKGVADAKRNKIFTKIMRELIIATREGGDVDANAKLRGVVLKARVVNMPKDNIEKAIKKGLSASEGENYEEIVYETYFHGVALVINVTTDNKNRSAGDVRSVLNKYKIAFGTPGSAARLFEQKGLMYLPAEIGEDAVLEVALEAGADDVQADSETIQVTSGPIDFNAVLEALQAKGWEIMQAEVEVVPMMRETLDKETAQKVLGLVEKLEELDDVQSVNHNADLSEVEEE